MGYEMTRPSQKWIGIGIIFTAFVVMLFTLAVPYVNHFGTVVVSADGSETVHRYTYYTRWNGQWKQGQQTTFNDPGLLLDFPSAAPWFIGLGLIITIIGAGYLVWLTYSNKACYFTREKPGPVGGSVALVGVIIYFIGNFIYEHWAMGTPRPLAGWPADSDFSVLAVRLSPTFWIGLVLGVVILALSTMNILYYFDTVSKRPVK